LTKPKTEETALAKYEDGALGILSGPAELMAPVADAIAEFVHSDEVTVWDFTHLRVPAGGATSWVLATRDGEAEEKQVDCIIITAQKTRQYWAVGFDEAGGGTPPDCSSPDGKMGYGDPGGDCFECPYSKWGTGKGKGKACSERRHLLILTEHGALPVFLNLPPTSVRAWKDYSLNQLAGTGLMPWHAYTRITLEKVQSGGGIAYAEARFKFLAPVEGEIRERVELYRASIEQFVKRTARVAAEQSE